MTKEEFAQTLRQKDMRTAIIDGCVTVEGNDFKEFDTIRQLAEDNGYCGSFGWRKAGADDKT